MKIADENGKLNLLPVIIVVLQFVIYPLVAIVYYNSTAREAHMRAMIEENARAIQEVKSVQQGVVLKLTQHDAASTTRTSLLQQAHHRETRNVTCMECKSR